MALTKTDIVETVAREAGVSQEVALDVCNTLILAISKSLERGESVTLRGFGTFRGDPPAFTPSKTLLRSASRVSSTVEVDIPLPDPVEPTPDELAAIRRFKAEYAAGRIETVRDDEVEAEEEPTPKPRTRRTRRPRG